MTPRITAAVAAVILGLAAPVASAQAFPLFAPGAPTEVRTTGALGVHDGVHDGPAYEVHPGFCDLSSASEGNANQQTRPVKQYGQTTGGDRC